VSVEMPKVSRLLGPKRTVQLMLDRLGALAGLLAGALFAVAAILGDPYDAATNPNPTAPADVVAEALTANRDEARLAAYLSLTGVFLLLWFVARLSVHTRQAGASGEWLSLVTYAGGVATGAVILLEVGFGFASSELVSYGADVQVAKLLFLWGWNSAILVAVPLSTMVVATTLASFHTAVFPAWFRWFGVASVVILFTFVLTGVFGMGSIVGMAWLMVTSAALWFKVRSPSISA